MAKSRKVRSDILVGNLEKKLGLEPGAIRNPDGSDARSNKRLDTLRKEFTQAKGTKVKTNPTISSKSITKASKAVSALSGTVAENAKKVQSVKPKTARKISTQSAVGATKPRVKKVIGVSKPATTTVKKSITAKAKKTNAKK
jgi:hypothetical protein